MQKSNLMTKTRCMVIILFVFCLSQLFAADCGDVNSNGDIDIVDGLLIARYYVDLNPENFDPSVADVDGNSDINIVDALLVARYYVGLITSFPGCTMTPVPTSEPTQNGQNAFATIEAEGYDNMSGIQVEACNEGGENIGYIENNDYSAYLINFTDVPSRILVRAAGSTSGGTIEVRLGSPSGTLISTVLVGGTGDWQSWQTFNGSVSNVSGVQTVYLVFKGGDGYLFNINWFTFISGTPVPTPTPVVVTYDLVVAQDGSGNYSSVQAAINAAPDSRTSWFTIYIKNGTYREVVTIPSSKTYLRLVGENALSTIITYNNYAGNSGGTSASASVFVNPNDFMAVNLTFENAFDYDNMNVEGKQAVALEPMGQRQIYLNCRITGHQDTLYLRNQSLTYFENCFVQGHTDFIFGDGTAVFKECEIRSRNRPGSSISAPATRASATYGIIFLNCTLTPDPGLGSNSIYLGRPWHPSSSSEQLSSCAVYLYCQMGSHISETGWTSMSGVYPETERMYEYQNTGSGAVINSSRRQLSASQAVNYTVYTILRGSDNWDPESVAGDFQ